MKYLTYILSLLFVLAFVGCDKTKEAASDVKETTTEAVEGAVEAVEEVAEEATEAVEGALETVGETAEEAKEAVEEVIE